MLVVRGLTEDDTIFDCSNYNQKNGKCRAGAPQDAVKKGEVCPFDDMQHVCTNYTPR